MTLRDNEVELRELEPGDSARLAELANNEKVSQNLRDGFPHPYTLADAEKFIAMFSGQNPVTVFAITYNGQYAGNISLVPCNDVYRKSAEIGYFLGEPYWNKGIATKAVGLITKYGFEKLGIARIYTGIFEFNPASMRVLEKNGFQKEGIFRKSIFKKGRLWDEHRYALINPENLSG